MDASIGEPFMLSSYATTKKNSKSSKSSKKSPAIFASHHRAGGSSEGYVTIAAQGNSVQVIDLSTLHPITSHSLGPATTLSCSSVTRSAVQGADHACTTYAAIASFSDISEDGNDCTIWMWKENLSSSVADRAAQKKKSVTLPHSISGLYVNDDLPSRVLVTSSQGNVTILHGDLQVQATRPSKDCEVLKVFVFSRKECTFLPPRTVLSAAAVMVSLVSTNGGLRIQALAVDSEDRFHELADIELPVKPEAFCDISFSQSGFFSILQKSGAWSSFELKPGDDSLYLNSLDTIHLASLSFISSSHIAETSVLSMGSSHVLLGGLTGPVSNREVIFLLWDLSFSVLLASRTMPLPSNISGDNISVTLIDALSSSNALLLLAPASSSSDGRKSSASGSNRSSIWVMPMTVPPSSSLASVLGRAAVAVPWLAPNGDDEEDEYLVAPSYDSDRTKLLNDMRSALDRNQLENANSAFFEWEKREQARESEEARESKEGDGNNNLSPPLYGYNFTRDLLNIVLQPSKPAHTPYSSQVVQHLLDKKVVSSSMLDVGLLTILRLRNDWKSIALAFTHVSDLQELEIVECLCYILARHRQTQRTASAADAMQVDSRMDEVAPSLPNFLAGVLRYAHAHLSPISLRAAFRRFLSDVDDVVCILQELDMWLGQWTGRDWKLVPTSKMMRKNEYGVLVLKTGLDGTSGSGGGKKEGDIPSMLEITTFLQTLLDTSFLALVQTPPAHPAHRLLRKIQTHIDPQIKFIEQTEQLRGHLEMFVRAQGKAIKEAKAASEGRKEPGTDDWRQRKKMMHEQAGMSIGLYQLEELTF